MKRHNRTTSFEQLETRSVLSLVVPALSSDPAATAKLYLDFDGHFESTWGGWSNVNTPAFSQDGDLANFSDAELAAIDEIFRRVSEDYAPFNVDVTTVDPGNKTDLVTGVVAIGGRWEDWYGNPSSGVTFTGGFASSGLPNVGYVFAASIGSATKPVAEISSHESGHLFGLRHQAVCSGGTLVSEYRDGVIMGNSMSTEPSRWALGTTSACAFGVIQDDLSLIGSYANRFGPRSDDYAALSPLPNGTTNGLIGDGQLVFAGTDPKTGQPVYNYVRSLDSDVFEFTTTGGAVSLITSTAPYGPDLVPTVTLTDSLGATVASGQAVNTTLPAGTYRLTVTTDGVYGNLGRYQINASYPVIVEPPPPAPVLEIDDTPVLVGPWGSINVGLNGRSWTAKQGTGSSYATWSFASLPAGTYEVFATWHAAGWLATNSPFSVNGTEVRINQRLAPSDASESGVGWKRLAILEIVDGSVEVRLTNAANGTVEADAVMVRSYAGDIAQAIYFSDPVPRRRKR